MRSIARESVMLAGAFLLLAGATAQASEGYSFEVTVTVPVRRNGAHLPGWSVHG